MALSDGVAFRQDRKWAAFEVGVVEPRQNGKGGILEARQLAGLFLFRTRLQTHTAHRFDTCLEHFRRVRELIESERSLLRQVRRISDTNGKEHIELTTGERLLFKARSKGSGRGFDGENIYFDEAFWLLELGPMFSTMSAQPNPQVWYTSSAPLPRMESAVLRGVMRRGRRGEARMAYCEWSAPVDLKETPLEQVDLDNRDYWYAANPALGVRISEDFVAAERNAMTDEEFARERLGLFPDLEGDPPAIPIGDWHLCQTPGMELFDPVALGVDVTPARSWGAIAAAAPTATGDGVELIDHQRGTSWIVPRLQELVANHAVSTIIVDRVSAAAALVPAMEEAGLPVRQVDTSEHKAACGELYDAIVDHTLQHLDQPGLEAAVVGASKRDVGDAWMWNRRGGADISPLVAVTLARIGRRDPDDKKPVFAF